MKLVFYSGGNLDQNAFLHECLADLVGQKRSRSFTYIPSCFDGSDEYFEKAVERYKKFGFSKFNCFPIDTKFSEAQMERAFSSDVIYLAGGNTFYLMHHIRKSRLMARLRGFARDGGVIAGLSAGGIILTPNVGLAGYPQFDRDENEVELQNLNALNLVPFEFFPHYSKSSRHKKAINLYARKNKTPVIACADGGGIVVHNDETQFIGNAYLFEDGVCTQVSER